MTQLWQPSNPPSHTAKDDGTFYGHQKFDLAETLAKATKEPQPLPDRVDHTTPVEIRNAFIEKFWSDEGPSAAP